MAGGGAPGPINQLNAAIYYPPYLFKKDDSGDFALRPVIQNPLDILGLKTPYAFDVSTIAPIQRVTLVKTGSITHSFNFDQRFLEVPFQIIGNRISINVQENSNVLTPGYYLLFVIDSNGVPSVGKIVSIASSTIVSASLTSNDFFATFNGNNKIGLNGAANISGTSVVLSARSAGSLGSFFYRAPAAVDSNTSLTSSFKFRVGNGTDGGDGLCASRK
ncbi:MAG: galactose oxidase early set domain-containing protein [Pseudomonadota bacterium]